MIDNHNLDKQWWHKVYKAFFYLFLFIIVALIFFLQPTADVPAPIIYGILIVLAVDSLYYEGIVRMITGKAGNGIVKSFFKKPSSVLTLGLLRVLLAGLIAAYVPLELGGDSFDFLTWFTVATVIGILWYITNLNDRIKRLEEKLDMKK